MGLMAELSIQLPQDISIADLKKLVSDLKSNPRRLPKGDLICENDLDSGRAYFDVEYEHPENVKKPGSVSPKDFYNILVGVQIRLVDEASLTGSTVLLPTKSNSKQWAIFYLLEPYKNSLTQNLHKDIIEVLHQVAYGTLKETVEDEDEIYKTNSITRLSNYFRESDLIENWIKEKGVKAFANTILEVPPPQDGLKLKKENFVPGRAFGPEYRDDYYSFENSLGALNEYHKLFQEQLKESPVKFPNYNHPTDSKERKAIEALEKSPEPFFPGNNAFEQVLVSNEDLEKLSIEDRNKLKEFIKIYDEAIKALKKTAPKTVVGGAEAEDTEGGEQEELEEKPKKEKLISFDDLYQIIEDELFSSIYTTYYQELIDQIDESTEKVSRYDVRKAVLSQIRIDLDSTQLRNIIENLLNSSWQHKVSEEGIYNDDELAKLVEDLITQLVKDIGTTELFANEKIKENVLSAIESAKDSPTTREVKKPVEEVEEIDGNTVQPLVLDFIESNIPEAEKENWEKLTTPDKISYWKNLTIRERKEFLKEQGFWVFVDSYSDELSQEFIENQLARNNLTQADRAYFEKTLQALKNQTLDRLIAIPPTEYSNDPWVFINTQRKNKDFLQIERDLVNQFAPKLANEIKDYLSQTIPQEVNVDDLLDRASNQLLKDVEKNLGLKDIELETFDKSESIKEINFTLREYLNTNPGELQLLSSNNGLTLFLNKHRAEFLDKRGIGYSFVSRVESRFHQAHRQQLLTEIQRNVGGLSLNETLNYIITQAVLSQVNPEDYINSLDQETLAALFGVDKELINDVAFMDNLKELLLEYMKVSRKTLDLDNKIVEPQEISPEEFTDDFLFLRQQGRRISPQSGGRILFSAIVEEGPSDEELAQLGQIELDELAKQDFERQRLIKQAFWEAYSEEQRALLEAQNLQNAAVYNWEREINKQAQANNQVRSKKEKRSLLKRGVDKFNDKSIIAASTAATGALAGLMVPGGGIVAGAVNALPIPDKYKKYISTGVLGGTLAAIAGTAHLFMNTAGGLIGGVTGGVVGGIVGFLSGGPIGVIGGATSGWFGGTLTGAGVEAALGGAFKGLGEGISSGLNSLSSATSKNISSSLKGAIPSSTGAVASKLQAVKQITPSSVFNNLFGSPGAAAVMVSTVGTALLATLVTMNIHSGFLQRLPEVNPEFEDSSKYVILEKKALEGNEFDDPREITYSLSITPKEGYEIEITEPPNDEFSFKCNEEKKGSCPDNTNTEEFSNYRNFVAKLVEAQGAILTAGEKLDLGTYTVPFDSKYDDASVENTFSINFNVIEDGEIIEGESTKKTESICFGECPRLKEGCWPTTGLIRRIPYEPGATHENVDAFDISNSSLPNVYSTSDGEACFFEVGSGQSYDKSISPDGKNIINGKWYPYGNHVLVKSGAYALFYAHLASLEEPSGTCADVTAGTIIGKMGTTGNSTGPHLHWEMRILGNGFMSYSGRIPGQSFNMSGQTLLEQHSPENTKVPLLFNAKTCYE